MLLHRRCRLSFLVVCVKSTFCAEWPLRWPEWPLFFVEVAGPVAGMAGGVAALFRPEAGPCFFKRPVLFARGRYERPLSLARCILRWADYYFGAGAAQDATCSAVVWLASLPGLCRIRIVYNLNNLNKLAHAEWQATSDVDYFASLSGLCRIKIVCNPNNLQ